MSLTNTFAGRSRSQQLSSAAFDVFQLEDRNAPGSILLPSLFLNPLSSFGDGLEVLVGDYQSNGLPVPDADAPLAVSIPVNTQLGVVQADHPTSPHD